VRGRWDRGAGGGHASGDGALGSTSADGSGTAALTIDSFLANSENVTTDQPFNTVRVGVTQNLTEQLQYGICAYDAQKPAPIIVNAPAAYNALFGSVASAAGMATFRRRSELLDFAHADITRTLRNFPGSGPERAKIELYLESLENLQLRQQLLLGAESTLRAVDPGGPSENPLYDVDSPLERLSVQFELATSALLGNLTNVAVVASGVSGGFGNLRYTSLEDIYRRDPNFRGVVTRHTTCHESGGNDAYRDVIHAVTGRHIDMIATMARTLAAAPEGDGTMLDNTVIVYLSDNGDDHHSQGWEWPVLLVGGQNMGFKTDGRAVVYPANDQASHRQLSNLFNTLGHAAGEDLNDFGQEGSTRVAEGPLSEIFG